MITYDTLRELAHALSKVTGYRYVAFCESYKGYLFTTFSDSEMSWHEQKSIPRGFWAGELDSETLTVKGLPFLDWSQCQFDCKEAENEED